MAEAVMNVSIARDFSPFPAGRYERDGRFTGEAFRRRFVSPALANHELLVIDLDGVEGLPSSFWEEVFGGLIRSGVTGKSVADGVRLVTTDPELSPYVDLAWKFVADAEASIH